MKTHKIYALICPIANEVRYIGATKHSLSSRLSQHTSDYKKKSKKGLWMNELREQNLKASIILIEEVSDEEWKDKERYYIKLFRDKTPDLKNTSDGFGHMPTGIYKRSEELKQQAAERMRIRNIEFPLPPEFYDKLAEGKRKKIVQSTKDGVFVNEYKSVAEAAKQILHLQKDGILTRAANSISNQLNGRSKSAFGFVWSYK